MGIKLAVFFCVCVPDFSLLPYLIKVILSSVLTHGLFFIMISSTAMVIFLTHMQLFKFFKIKIADCVSVCVCLCSS